MNGKDRSFTAAGLIVTLSMAAALLMLVGAAVWQVTHGHTVDAALDKFIGVFAVGLPSLLARTRPDPATTSNVVNTAAPLADLPSDVLPEGPPDAP